MTTKLLNEGREVIARNLAGEHIPINGAYIAYGPKAETSAPDSSAEYFRQLADTPGCGYMRVRVSSKLEGGKVLFTAMLNANDPYIGNQPKKGTVLTTVTLVHFEDGNPAKDKFIYSTVLNNSVKLLNDTYLVVNIGINIGE